MQAPNPSLKPQPFCYLRYCKSLVTFFRSELIKRDQQEQSQVNYRLVGVWLFIYLTLSVQIWEKILLKLKP